jgi:hypothetical protein
MAYDKSLYASWEKQFPDATDAEKKMVKEMYQTDNKLETDEEVVTKQNAPALDVPKK